MLDLLMAIVYGAVAILVLICKVLILLLFVLACLTVPVLFFYIIYKILRGFGWVIENVDKPSKRLTEEKIKDVLKNIIQKISQIYGKKYPKVKVTRAFEVEMVKAGLNRKLLAEKLGVSPAYLDQNIDGNRGISLETALKLQRAIGSELSLSQLFDITD